VMQRFPRPNAKPRERASVWIMNFAVVGLALGLISIFGFLPWLFIQLTATAVSCSVGVWLFYVQHQFEHTTWQDGESWNMHDAALHGSSHYDLPRVLAWFTANIGVHHVHHLCSRIPYYRLPRVLREHPSLGEIVRLSLVESVRCVRLTLWDEARERLISFRELRRAAA
ncbi:MAG: fatty acid desaturase, partial [Pseudolabrys sp.]